MCVCVCARATGQSTYDKLPEYQVCVCVGAARVVICGMRGCVCVTGQSTYDKPPEYQVFV